MEAKKILVVIDMQYDFISGSLGNEHVKKTVLPNVRSRIGSGGYKAVVFTQDTHEKNYLETLEGIKLPVVHCVRGTKGYQIEKSLIDAAEMQVGTDVRIVEKNTFGSIQTLGDTLKKIMDKEDPSRATKADSTWEIEICGVCTDICVVSDALILRSTFPNTVIKVISSCCGGTSKEAHDAAIRVMQSCQIDEVQ